MSGAAGPLLDWPQRPGRGKAVFSRLLNQLLA